jgi:hypothetical protein
MGEFSFRGCGGLIRSWTKNGASQKKIPVSFYEDRYKGAV